VRVTIAIEPKLSTVAEGIPAVASESSRESAAGVKPLRARRFTSPPRSALDCALIALNFPLGHSRVGSSRRLELSRILFAGSDLLLLDEPTNHLDADVS